MVYIDPAAPPQALAAGQGFQELMVPARAVQKDQSMWPFAFVANPFGVVDTVLFYWMNPAARVDIGSRAGFVDVDNRLGARLRDITPEQTTLPLAAMAQQLGMPVKVK